LRSYCFEIVKFLSENKITEDDAFICAAWRGNLSIVKYLLENGFTAINENISESILFAAESNHLEVVKYLYENGFRHEKAIMEARINSHQEIVDYLTSVL